jgi:hypothetical protein
MKIDITSAGIRLVPETSLEEEFLNKTFKTRETEMIKATLTPNPWLEIEVMDKQ